MQLAQQGHVSKDKRNLNMPMHQENSAPLKRSGATRNSLMDASFFMVIPALAASVLAYAALC